MDREKAIKLLKGGPERIKEWNSLDYDVRMAIDLTKVNLDHVDLSGVDLSEVDLSHAELSLSALWRAWLDKANLSNARLGPKHRLSGHLPEINGAVLYDASLRRADLRNADVWGAELVGADLSGANLSNADFAHADLSRANLNYAKCVGTNFRGAKLSEVILARTNLSDADLTDASCSGTVFADVDLSNTKGLVEVRHLGPSTVGLDTIQKSGGKIPEVFLRGCGVPEEWITYLPSLIGALSRIEFHSCFISFSIKDEEFCKRLHGRLTQDKLRVWFAPEDMKRGQKIHEQIESAIRVHDKLLLVLSEKSMASEWVDHEIV